MNKRRKKLLIIFGIVLLVAAIAWAAAELSGQANAAAADAGDQSHETEAITLNMIKKQKPEKQPPSCDWQLEKNLRKKIEINDEEYKKVVANAKNEAKSAGKVSLETGDILLYWATSYKDLQKDYASMWGDCKCTTRANLARELAETRLRNAEVTMSEIDKEKLDALKAQQEKLKQARSEYVAEAKRNDEISANDKMEMQAKLIPRTQSLVSNLGELVQKVTGLLQQVQESATKAKSGGFMGGLKTMTSLSSGGLLQQVQALLSLVQNMLTNAQDLSSDVQTLSGS
jgi:hypothetical protein